MRRIVLRDRTIIPPFGEPARDLRILNKPLWVLQKDLLKEHCRGALAEELDFLSELPATQEELFVYRDNLYFNQALVDTFVAAARATGHACQIAFDKADKAIIKHALPLQEGIRENERGEAYVADMYYFPHGAGEEARPLVIDTQPREMGYYHIPSYMAQQGDLVFQIPLRVFLSIENWVHVFLANSPFGVFAMGRAQEQLSEDSWREKLAISFSALKDRLNPFAPRWRNHFLACTRMVKVGKNCSIDPTATIHGPTIIGDNVHIGPGVTITNSVIGNGVNIMQGSQVMLSVVSNGCYLPFNSGLFMTTFMENTMVAQLTCLQMCVVGSNTFIGAGNIFTDFNLWDPDWPDGNKPSLEDDGVVREMDPRRIIHTYHKGKLTDTNLPVLGCAIGHNCKIGSGFIFYPARMVGSNTTMIYANPATVVTHNVNVPLDETTEEQQLGATPVRTVYFWPDRYDPQNPDQQKHTAEGRPSLNEPFEMSLFESASAGLRRRHR